MNERIKQLADQATSYMPGRPPYDGLTFDMFDKEKFAELIVEECIKLNGKELAMAGHSRMVDVYCDHFGIKF
jgi:hypothetical protein